MSQSAAAIAPSTTKSEIETSTIRTISWRLIPFLVLAYFFSYLDRVNLGFAALTMNAELKFSPTIFAWGAGIFFIGYFIFEVPSNLALQRFGARTWIARIMISWGIVSAAFALIGGPTSFLVLRFLLGVAEAGFFPGVILYFTYWYPARYRATIVGIFMVAIPVAGLIGSPISGGRWRAYFLWSSPKVSSSTSIADSPVNMDFTKRIDSSSRVNRWLQSRPAMSHSCFCEPVPTPNVRRPGANASSV